MRILVFVLMFYFPSVILSQNSDFSISCNCEQTYFIVDSTPRFKGKGISEFKAYVVRELHQSPIAFNERIPVNFKSIKE